MNRSGVIKSSVDVGRDILFCTNPCVAIGVRVAATGLTAGADGKRRILAGQALGGSTPAISNRLTELTVVTDGTAQGVTQHDIVFEVGETTANANMIIFGFVDPDKMDPTVAAVPAAVVTALEGKVTFVNGK